jgi:hypothetical protein
MKTLNFRVATLLVALIAALTVTGSADKVQAGPSPHAAINGFCDANNDFGHSHGECVSIAETNVNALANRGVTDGVTICKVLEEVFGPFPLGDCVSRFAAN